MESQFNQTNTFLTPGGTADEAQFFDNLVVAYVFWATMYTEISVLHFLSWQPEQCHL